VITKKYSSIDQAQSHSIQSSLSLDHYQDCYFELFFKSIIKGARAMEVGVEEVVVVIEILKYLDYSEVVVEVAVELRNLRLIS